MKINLLKKRYFLLLFIFLIFILHSIVHDKKIKTIDGYLTNRTNLIYLEYKVIYNNNKNMADLIFKTEINTPKIITLFKNRQRNELFKEVTSHYQTFRNFSVRQVHFHLPNNNSFLRMHRPKKFGDNLSKARLTVKYVNENQKYIDGFEEGKIFNGFRFVYPLFDDKRHIGSVEISFSALAFIKDIAKNYKIKSNLLIDKNVVNEKVFKSEQSNYIQSPLAEFYFQKSILAYLNMDLSNKKLSKKKDALIYKKIQDGEAFSRFDDSFKQIVTFIPLKNPISKKVVAALTFRSNDLLISDKLKYTKLIFFISIVIIAAVLFLIYKELKYKKDLEQEVADRTLELQNSNKMLEEMAHTDALTGIYNRRYFYEISREIIALNKRENQHLSLAMIDIDKFKDVNDTYGHDKGDMVLQALVGEIISHIRESDIFVRFGGEEFVLLFPNTKLENAVITTKKIRSIIASSNIIEGISFTISAGVSEFRETDTIEDMLKRADVALYEAKNSGRNRVHFY